MVEWNHPKDSRLSSDEMVFEDEAKLPRHGRLRPTSVSKAGFPCFDLLPMPRRVHVVATY
jgi:hypothetical protein